jgi:glycosyltransferase involved in cell wall biosynthesis
MPREGRIRSITRCIAKVKPDIFVPVSVVDAYDAVSRVKFNGGDVRHVMAIHGNTPALIADMARYKEFADLVVCPGALTSRLAVEWAGVPAERVRHIPNGGMLPMSKHISRKPGDPIRLGYVGRLVNKDKRVLDMIALCRRLQELGVTFSLDIVGTGEAREELEKGLQEVLDSTHVHFHGQMSLEEIYRDIYPRLDCLLLFSPAEAFGISIVEGMMHGVVPVSSRFIGHGAEGILVDEETALLFDVGDTSSAAECVQILASDTALWKRLSLQAQNRVSNDYTWERSHDEWVDALEHVLEMPPCVGKDLPNKHHAPAGTLDRLGIPAGITDAARRLRRYCFGVPSAMIGGEEWPLINKDYEPELLKKIELRSKQLDSEARAELLHGSRI